MNLADQLAPVLALAAEKGVEVVPPWLYYDEHDKEWKDGDSYGVFETSGRSAALIVTGSLSAWLAGQGIAVVYDPITSKWTVLNLSKGWSRDLSTTDHLSALIAAATARLAELPNKENADDQR